MSKLNVISRTNETAGFVTAPIRFESVVIESGRRRWCVRVFVDGETTVSKATGVLPYGSNMRQCPLRERLVAATTVR